MNNITFSIDRDAKKIKGELFYCFDDVSFLFKLDKPHEKSLVYTCDISLVYSYLILDFDITLRLATDIGGLHPHYNWFDKKLNLPTAPEGGLILDQAEQYAKDIPITMRVLEVGEWETYYDKESCWLCFGDYVTKQTDEAVEFAEGIIVVLADKQIKAIWMKPIFVPASAEQEVIKTLRAYPKIS